ncbi:hypothetical protein RFI_11622 [Reticulomyxa filosa]|uniref:Uncharacterized protein n=1 Tax=Reticulomyxa filosa TaxID=46433 RepID=X6NJI1_RETFI|nr:hypothetical protein RFI_11622 [Reticulomyxa filosa]|eukprot:ETO25512.1 hypothetical protein RFI_11622 [Reticulomyxa filosa]
MGTPRDVLPLQGQISESITPHNPLMLENGALIFSSQTVSQNNFNGIKSDDLKAVLSTPQGLLLVILCNQIKNNCKNNGQIYILLKDRVHGGGQNIATVSNTPLPIPVTKLGVPGVFILILFISNLKKKKKIINNNNNNNNNNN